MRRRLWSIALAVLLSGSAGCGAGEGGGAADGRLVAALGDSVNAFGSLKDLMMNNDTSAVIDLEALTPDSALYAVGALAGLAGEITVLGGAVHLARADDAYGIRESVTDTTRAAAALLVAARVERWQEVPVETPIAFDELDLRIGELAAGAGVDVTRPFVFIVEGPMAGLSWHAIEGRRLPAGESGQAAHLSASARQSLGFSSAVLVGFYSTRHEGIFTHMGARTHVHAIVPAAQSSGHLDGVVIEPGATLRLPAP